MKPGKAEYSIVIENRKDLVFATSAVLNLGGWGERVAVYDRLIKLGNLDLDVVLPEELPSIDSKIILDGLRYVVDTRPDSFEGRTVTEMLSEFENALAEKQLF